MSRAWLGRILGWPLAHGVRAPCDPADAVVVLGAPLGAGGALTPVVRERVDAGVALWRRGVAPLLCLTGGRTRGALVAEADAMATAVRAAGVPESALVVESESRNTWENARNLAAILLPAGRTRVVLVTQPFHLRRSRMHFARWGFAPTGFLIDDSVQYRSPRSLGWVLREYPSLVRDYVLWLK